MKTYGTTEVLNELSGQLHAPPFLSRGESPQFPLDMRLGGLQSRSGRCAEETNLCLARDSNPAVQPLARR
jgi:hypothetical protein